jgi:hypothetical protein
MNEGPGMQRFGLRSNLCLFAIRSITNVSPGGRQPFGVAEFDSDGES